MQVQAIPELLDFGNISVDVFFSNFDLDAICSVDPLFELELNVASVPEETELEAAKTMVAAMKNQLVNLISNLPEIIEAAKLLINSSIPETKKWF